MNTLTELQEAPKRSIPYPKGLEDCVRVYIQKRFDPIRAEVLGGVAYFKDKFVLDSIPKEWLEDSHFQKELTKLLIKQVKEKLKGN